MRNFKKNYFFNKKIRNTLLLMTILGVSMMFLIANNAKSSTSENSRETQVKSSSDDVPLFQGIENSLNITDYGKLNKINQKINVNDKENVNLSYYLDEVHNWEVSEVETQINNIQDERDWVDNGDIGSNTGLTPTSHVSQSEDSGPSYGKNLNPNNYMATFDGNDCDYMRIHFVLLEVEYYYDELYISNQDNTVLDNFAGYYTDFYTPWYNATELKISIDSDVTVELYGYSVDFFETYNGSMFTLDSTNWNYFEDTINDPSRLYGGTAEIGNRSALRTVIEGIDSAPSYSYEDGDIAGFYQNLTIPRGKIIDAWVSMDYNVLRGIYTNDNYAYIKLNGETVYSRGFRTITNAGLGQWHSTGLINLDLWENSSRIFDEVLIGQSINLSVGIEIGNGVEYTGFDHLDIQEAYFDNIQLILKTSANSTQSGINLQFNNSILNDDNTWGVSYLNLTGNWNNNPLKLTVTTDSPSLSFDLDTTIYGYHKSKSRVGQTTLEGISYEILKNGTIVWEFSHNLYMPAQYSDFEFTIIKPRNWNFISALDPTLQSRVYEYGNEGDTILKINKDNALYPGWWTFKATSPNFLNLTNTKLVGESDNTFFTGESTILKTQVNYTNQIPSNLDDTSVNLTIYDPNDSEWFFESKTPLSNGTVFFSELYFDALNTTGGEYEYTLFWSNGTCLGGLNSSFFVIHNSLLSLLKPNDAISDLITDAFLGDIIPVRIKLFDSENNDSISNAIISYNWTNEGVPEIKNFEEAALGIYETNLETSELVSNGFYEILIQSFKVGFENYNLTLRINLGEETRLQRLESDYNIEMHANSTIKFNYYSTVSKTGINRALVEVNITNPELYFIKNSGDGLYDIQFNTSFIDDLGIYELNFNFTAPSYEPQTHIYQFRIVEQSINITTSINNQNIDKNSIIEVNYMEQLNVSAKAKANIDNELLSGGNFTWIVDFYQQSLNEEGDSWYNASIIISPSVYSAGLNLIEIKFEMSKYKTDIFYFQLLVHEQPVELSAYIDSQAISENEIIETMYMENFTISVRAYATLETNYITGALITWQGGNQDQELVEDNLWYNLTIQVISSNYTPGLNSIAIQFMKDDYQTKVFSFQLLVQEQSVELSTYLNSQAISENQIIDAMYMETITVSVRAFATVEMEYITGSIISWQGGNQDQALIETSSWYNLSIQIVSSNYTPGLNSIAIQFIKNDYQTEVFSFQLLVHEQSIELSAYIDSQAISENEIIETMYMENLMISVRAFATVEVEYINGALVTWQGGNQDQSLIEVSSWYNLSIQIVPINYTAGLNSITIQFVKDDYQTKVFSFQLLVKKQSVELSSYADSKEILDNQLIEVMFKQTISFSLRAYGTVDLNYISGAQVHWDSQFYYKDFIENGDWYNLSIIFTASNFSSGINSVSIKFEKENYTTIYFSFQLLLREQSVVLNASINDQSIPSEGALIELMFKENITISAQAFAMGETIYLTGGNISLISGSFHFDFDEVTPTWFTLNFIIDGAYFDLGINTVSIKFEQANYTVSYLSFQFFITAETVNLSLYAGSNEIQSNNLIQVTYYDDFSLSLRAMANAEKIHLSGGSAILVIGDYHQEFIENDEYWYNINVTCDPDNFDLGINTVYVSFTHPNYITSKFYFQVLVNQIEMNAKTIDFQDSIERYSGDSVLIRINLTESITTNIIENATIRYSWEYGLGNLEYVGSGIYEATFTLPENVRGSYKVSLIILTDSILFKAMQTSFIVVISPRELPNFMLWIIIGGATIAIGILGALSIRSYVILPRKRRKEAELLSKTQNFKDLQNIQAIVLMHRYSGIPLYSKSYSILEKQKKELFAGFVQAITSIGEEIAGKRSDEGESRAGVVQNLFELDFKYFHCLICDRDDLRIVVVLTEKASENLKNDIINLAAGITLNLNDLIEHWDGALETFENEMPPILKQYLDLYYKEPFILNNVEFISELRKEVELSKMETRVLNTVYSMAKSKKSFFLDYIIETVSEENKDVIIEAIESLISNKIILPTSK